MILFQMFRCLTKDVTNPDIPILMEEFLLGLLNHKVTVNIILPKLNKWYSLFSIKHSCFLVAGCYIGSIRQINRSICQFISYSSGQPYSIQRQTVSKSLDKPRSCKKSVWLCYHGTC